MYARIDYVAVGRYVVVYTALDILLLLTDRPQLMVEKVHAVLVSHYKGAVHH